MSTQLDALLSSALSPPVREVLRTEIKTILLELMVTNHEDVRAFIRNVLRDEINLERQELRRSMRYY